MVLLLNRHGDAGAHTADKCSSWESFEISAVNKLVQACGQLARLDYGAVSLHNARARQACSTYLKEIELCAKTLAVKAAPRAYRSNFSVNYQMLFGSDQERHYLIDVLEAGLDRCPSMWVNGKMFSFSPEIHRRSDELKYCFEQLGSRLYRWRPLSPEKPSKTEIKGLLAELDQSWATFERDYINRLIEIETGARTVLAEAVERERCMTVLEEQFGKHCLHIEEYLEEQHQLFICLAELNSLANVSGKGRGDLDDDTLTAARELIRDHEGMDPGTLGLSLANDFVDSFESMRHYLREVGQCMQKVDPQLQKNRGLVARMEDLEDAWTLCSRFVQDKSMNGALECTTAAVEVAQTMVPGFRQMCLDCDAEFFMVLPRVVWLGFLRDPEQEMLLKSLLPHYFDLDDRNAPNKKGMIFERFVEHFRSTQQLLIDAREPGELFFGEENDAAWEILVHRAVLGTSLGCEMIYDDLAPSLREGSKNGVEDFMRELEAWSMELQRHCPRDWNAFSAMLVQWSAGSLKKTRQDSFCV